MSASIALDKRRARQVDRSALLLMLSYIEAECRRIGATAAADHAALAAALVPPGNGGRGRTAATAAPRRRARGRLH
ncbi:hypothetical protein [Caldovatus aquaticus]|uniref:Uncharacterized protein n=1 Tax=Caldovatus aquaticus TaxID=2865671 RepID=A0ABS7F184_9PROT|nr:hypothetical protein [Caldovatus aquaticus]MBW8269381.1 hypothetical protein [Caldovatus aquaticus]